MKKLLVAISLIILVLDIVPPVYALNVGTYKTETEYGLLDGFKINWKRKDKSQPFIEPREGSTQKDKEIEMRQYKEDEYQRTKYMYEGRSIL